MGLMGEWMMPPCISISSFNRDMFKKINFVDQEFCTAEDNEKLSAGNLSYHKSRFVFCTDDLRFFLKGF